MPIRLYQLVDASEKEALQNVLIERLQPVPAALSDYGGGGNEAYLFIHQLAIGAFAVYFELTAPPEKGGMTRLIGPALGSPLSAFANPPAPF